MRGAVIGAGLRGGFALFSLLTKARRRRLATRDVAEAAIPTLRYAAFLAVFSGVYVGADESLAEYYGRERSKHWRAAAAGAAAGPAILLTGQTQTSLAVYIFLRSLVLLSRCALRRPGAASAWVLAPLRTRHGDVALMCAAAAQLLYAWFYAPHTLPKSYVSFLNKQGGQPGSVVRQLAAIGRASARHGDASLPLAATVRVQTRTAPPAASALEHFHECIHPGESCTSHFLRFPLESFRRAYQVYVPVYLVPMVLVHRKRLFTAKGPAILRKTALGGIRSTLFLTTYCTLAWGGACLFQNTVGHPRPWTVAASTWVAGLALLLEKKSRRMELALYCAARAAESFARCSVDWGWLSPRWRKSRLDVLLFCAASSTIMHCYNTERDVFRSKYLNVLDWVFGNEGHLEQRIRHVASTLSFASLSVASTSSRATFPSSITQAEREDTSDGEAD